MEVICQSSELLKTLSDQSSLPEYYPKNSVINHPPLFICNDKLTLQNKDIYQYYMDTRPIVVNGISGCEEPYNLRSQYSAELQRGYARNIDIDSELKRINYYADKCFYDRYKVDPRNPPPALFATGEEPNRMRCVANTIVHDYAEFRHERLSPRKLPHTPATLTTFNTCQHPSSSSVNRPQLYSLPSDKDNSCVNWECQQVFHNFTKRKILSPFNNVQDLNPSTLRCCHS
jgi:hypothetical protein